MRKLVPAVAALLVLGAATAFFLATRHPTPPAPATAVAAIAPLPAAPPSAPAASPVPSPAAPPKSPDLPTITVGERPVHVVPEDRPTPEVPITLETREGRVIGRSESPAPLPASAPAPRTLEARPLVGAATIAGGASLGVDGHTVRFFGVRAPGARDRCAAADGTAQPCIDIARAALAAQLKSNATVRCTMPPGQTRDPGFVCHDSAGADLGGFLVAEGLALADTTSSYQYFGAQGVARSFHRGLWRYR